MLKKLITKDRLYNLLFLFVVPLAGQIAVYFESIIMLFLSVTLVPYLITRLNKVTFKGKKFFNSEGIDLSKKLPFNFIVLCAIFALSFCISVGYRVDFLRYFGLIGSNFSLSIFILFSISLPIIYFIYKDVPISILFNRKSWVKHKTVYGFVMVPSSTRMGATTNRYFYLP